MDKTTQIFIELNTYKSDIRPMTIRCDSDDWADILYDYKSVCSSSMADTILSVMVF